MSVDGEAVRLRTEADEPGWEVDPDDEGGLAVGWARAWPRAMRRSRMALPIR